MPWSGTSRSRGSSTSPAPSVNCSALILLVAVGTSVGAIVRDRSPGFGLLTMRRRRGALRRSLVALVVASTARGRCRLFELIPGAIVFAVGVEALHLIVVYYLAARLTHASALYGSLGIAAAILFGLYLIGRLIIAAIVINVAVWERNHRERGGDERATPASGAEPG